MICWKQLGWQCTVNGLYTIVLSNDWAILVAATQGAVQSLHDMMLRYYMLMIFWLVNCLIVNFESCILDHCIKVRDHAEDLWDKFKGKKKFCLVLKGC